MSADPSPRRLHLWTVLVLVAVFAAGAATGAGLARAFRPHGPGPAGPRPPGDGLPPFVAELGLSPDQLARARDIAERHRSEIEAVVQEAFPRVRAVQDQVDQEIRAILTPEQAKRFDELRSRRPPLRGPGGRGDRPPGPPGLDPRGPPPGPPGDFPPPPPPGVR
jgi:hypothetical protein